MKHLTLLLLIIATLTISCKKEKSVPQSIVGRWELRNASGSQVSGAPSTYKNGNGNIVEFSANEFQRFEEGKATLKGIYQIVNEVAEIDGVSYTTALIYNYSNNSYSSKWYFKLSGDKLLMSIGPVASDGVTLTYQSIR